jgi:putative membrane protein
LGRWNLDPRLLAVLLAVLAVYVAADAPGVGGREDHPRWRRLCFYGGWAIFTLAVVSPLCALSVALFSARVGQHMLLDVVAAPLIALGLPLRLPPKARLPGEAVVAAAAFACAIWVWHAPGPYAETFRGETVYWLMHATSLVAAVWLWSCLLDGRDGRLGAGLAAAGLTAVQMGLLGAVITFAAKPLYAPHALTTFAWGLSPLQDQQLGGVIMWTPACLAFLAAVVGGMFLAMRRGEVGARVPTAA